MSAERWVTVVDPHSFNWDAYLSEQPHDMETVHPVTPTYEAERVTTYRLGNHTIHTTYRIITNRPPNVDTTNNTGEQS